MNSFKEIKPIDIADNACKLIGEDWMLITAGTQENFNTMTASWGGLGYLWEMNVGYCFIRPQRYTFGFMENADYYSFSFFEEKYRSVLNYCGTYSGRDGDKPKKAGITPVVGPNGTVYFNEARLVLVMRKLYAGMLEHSNFIDKRIVDEFYPPDNDIHKIYVGEIVKGLIR